MGQTTSKLKLRFPLATDAPNIAQDIANLAGDVEKNFAFTTPEAQGAVGNGSTDDTPFVQAALNTGLNVCLPNQYKISAKLLLRTTNQKIFGLGMSSRIIFDGAVVPVAIGMADTTQRSFIRLEDFRLTSTTQGAGLGIDASHFAIGYFHRVNIDGVNQGIDFNSNDCFYNFYSGRITCFGSGGFCVRIANGANENTLYRLRLGPDANSTGVIVNGAHSNELNSIDVETGALVGIDLQSGANATTIDSPYLEANQTNLRLASGLQGIVVQGGTIESASVANIDNQGAEVEFVNSRVQFAGFNWSSKPKSYNPGASSVDAVLLDMTQPTGASVLRDSHSALFRGTYTDGSSVGHNVDWKILTNVTSATGGSKLRIMNRLDNAAYVEKFSIDGSGVGVFSGRVQVGGPVQLPFAAKTGNYTISATTDGVITGDGGAGGITITLPSAVNIQGRSFTIKRINGTAGSVLVNTTSSQTIDGATTKTLGSQWAFITVTSDSANWIITSQGGTVS